jgi:hypothetical protein
MVSMRHHNNVVADFEQEIAPPAEVRLAAGLCRSRCKPNASPRAPGSFNQPADGVKHSGNLCIMLTESVVHLGPLLLQIARSKTPAPQRSTET